MFRSGSSAFEIVCSEGTALRPRLWDTDGNCYMYVPGERSDDWQKLKLENQKEFVISGYRPGFERHRRASSRYYDENGPRFAGKVRGASFPTCAARSSRR